LGNGEVRVLAGLAIQPFEHTCHAHPQISLVIFVQAVHQGLAEVGLGVGFGWQGFESRLSRGKQVGFGSTETGPDVAAAVLIQQGETILRQALRILGPVLVSHCIESLRIQLQQAVRQGAQPQRPGVVFNHLDGPGQWVARSLLVIEGVAGELPGIAIEAGEAVSGGVQDPECAGAILVEGQVAGFGNGNAQFDFAAERVELFQAAIVRYPEMAAAIRSCEFDVVAGETPGIRGVMLKFGGPAGARIQRIQS